MIYPKDTFFPAVQDSENLSCTYREVFALQILNGLLAKEGVPDNVSVLGVSVNPDFSDSTKRSYAERQQRARSDCRSLCRIAVVLAD